MGESTTRDTCSCPHLQALHEGLEQKIAEELDRIDRVCYTVDVREKFNTQRPVIATVVDRSDAMHALLFIRSTLRSTLLTHSAHGEKANG